MEEIAQANPMEVTLSEVVNPAECDRVLPLYQEFSESLPTNVVFNLTVGPRSKPRYGPEDFLIIAEDIEGSIVGFAANKVNATVAREPNPSPERLEFEEFLEFVKHKEHLDTPHRSIELRVLSVSERWRGRGVARRLVEASVVAARDAGYGLLTMCCINEFTARLARSLGWTEYFRLAYRDYPRLSGRRVQLTPNPPHDFVYCYYIEL